MFGGREIEGEFCYQAAGQGGKALCSHCTHCYTSVIQGADLQKEKICLGSMFAGGGDHLSTVTWAVYELHNLPIGRGD